MPEGAAPSLALACSVGGFKGVFVHGVLSAFEAAGLRADAYATASSSVFPAVCAAIGQSDEVGLRYWRSALHTLQQPGNGMSEVVLQSIADSRHLLHEQLFQAGVPRFIIATSAVKTTEGAEQTQGTEARRLGRRLLLSAARRDRSWVDQHLQTHLFDTRATTEEHRLTVDNIDAVIYASTRMLHAWTLPAWIASRPYIDASYTCACPAIEMAQQGYQEVIAIATEPGILYRDIFQSEPIPTTYAGVPIHIVRPDIDLASTGTDFTSMTEEGMVVVYAYGKEKGREFLAKGVRKGLGKPLGPTHSSTKDHGIS
ncbi:MAG: hypothetical protein ACJ788_25530 [Ktedonobacteraceae bacterium]